MGNSYYRKSAIKVTTRVETALPGSAPHNSDSLPRQQGGNIISGDWQDGPGTIPNPRDPAHCGKTEEEKPGDEPGGKVDIGPQWGRGK